MVLQQKRITKIFKEMNTYFTLLKKGDFTQLNSEPGFLKEFILDSHNYELIITFVDDKYIRKLNNKFLKRNYITDVIAFPMRESFTMKSFKNGSSIVVLGDIVISVERAKVQAKKFRCSFYEELALLIIHGTLHLLGYDDIKKKDTLIMRKKEQEILKTIKFYKV